MKNHAVAEGDALAFLEHQTAIALEAKAAEAEGVGGEQSISADVPSGGMAEAFGMIEDRNANGLPFDGAVVIDPFGARAPCGFVGDTVAVDTATALFAVHIYAGRHAHTEAGVFFVG